MFIDEAFNIVNHLCVNGTFLKDLLENMNQADPAMVARSAEKRAFQKV